jgi:hypothetical protein
VERRGPAVRNSSDNMGGRGALIKAPIDLQDLRRGIYAGGKAGLGGTGGVDGDNRRKHCRYGRSHKPWREAGRRAACGKSARSVVRPEKAGESSGSQSRRGNNRKPRSLNGRQKGNRLT